MQGYISKDIVIQILKSCIPDAKWLLMQIESQQGWLKLPSSIANIVTNLKIQNYPLLYLNETSIYVMLLHGFLSKEEIKELNEEIENASPEERGQFILEFVSDFDQALDTIHFPNAEKDREKALLEFETLRQEDREKYIRAAQHLHCTFFAAFHQTLSVMVHGEKLTSLVSQAVAGNDDAFVKAIQIDKRILTTIPYFIDRVSRAQNEGESGFFDFLSYRLRTPPYKGKIRHKALWLAFSLLDQVRLLDLPHSELLEICDEAGIDAYGSRIQSVKHLTSRLHEYREFQKKGIVTTN